MLAWERWAYDLSLVHRTVEVGPGLARMTETRQGVIQLGPQSSLAATAAVVATVVVTGEGDSGQ